MSWGKAAVGEEALGTKLEIRFGLVAVREVAEDEKGWRNLKELGVEEKEQKEGNFVSVRLLCCRDAMAAIFFSHFGLNGRITVCSKGREMFFSNFCVVSAAV